MFILYDIFFIVFALAYFPYVLLKRKWHPGFVMRFGIFPEDIKQKLLSEKNIWVHAVSVGEVMAVKHFVRRLKELHPDAQIVISTVTVTGNQLAREHFSEAVTIFAPLDFSLFVRSHLRLIRPEIYIAAETEIWPNIFYAMSRKGIPVIQINGRISDKSYRRYRRLRGVLKTVLSHVTRFAMQTPVDAQRIISIGADPKKVTVTGNMKFDDILSGQPAPERIFAREGARVIVAGSTYPGEEDILVKIFLKLKQKYQDIAMILAPRHIERAADIEGFLVRNDCHFSRLSGIINKGKYAEDILLVDTIGHLRGLYAQATIVFVGKSLTGRGGQNILEPASFAKPIIVGPYMDNFRAITDLFSRAGALITVYNEEELREAISALLDDPDEASRLGRSGYQVIKGQQGSVEKTLQEVEKLLAASRKQCSCKFSKP
ncbi:MAG: 3-deoxy-D-manno-octulosonic acid transferase [Candidatus Omnitrophota bacterium]